MSSRAKTINNNKFENRAQVCATSVFHQFLCRLIVQFKFILKKYHLVVIISFAILVLIMKNFRCHFSCFAYEVMTYRSRLISFVRYHYSLYATVSKFRVLSHCVLVCLEDLYKLFLSTTSVILNYYWSVRYFYFFISNYLLQLIPNRHYIPISNIAVVKFKK